MLKVLYSLSLLSSLSYSASFSISPTNPKPLMTYSNYSENQPLKLSYFNNNVNYPIIPRKMSYSTYNNFTSSTLMNTKTLNSYYSPFK